jgi:bacteriorhodopsin
MSYLAYSAVYNALSFTIAAMGAATLFFWLNRSSVAPAYRIALTITGVVTAIATYHYVRIFESWTDAFTIVGEVARPSGQHFNDGYRYVDWLLTVPLLLIELLLVMRLPADETRSRGWRLGLAAIAMIVLGYPGESASSNMVRAFWGTASTIPFVYIMWQLFRGLGDAIDRQPDEVRGRIRQARLLTLATWGFYPIVYMVPYMGERTAGIEAAVQIGYTLADVLAKAGFGLLIFSIARAKSRHEPADQVEYLASESGGR